MLESRYQSNLIIKLRKMFPGCVILKNDSSYMQGIPDLTIFYGTHWAMLEVKAKPTPPGSDSFEPNQEWYIDQLNDMSFAACIYPQNEEEVLRALQLSWQSRRKTRISVAQQL